MVDITQLSGLEPPPQTVDMRRFLQPDLVLTDRTGRDWTIAPPSAKVGAILAAATEWGTQQIIAATSPEEAVAHAVRILTEHVPAPPGVLDVAARALADAGLLVTKPQVSAETERLFRENEETPLEVLALGKATVDAMEEAGVPGVDVQVFGKYATYVWLYGPDVAERIMRASVGEPQREEVEAGKALASEMTSASGSPTESAPSSGTTSTARPSSRTTTSRTSGGRTTASRSGKRKRKR